MLQDCVFADQVEGIRLIQNAVLEDIVFIGQSENKLGNERRIPGHYGKGASVWGKDNPTAGLFFNKRCTGKLFRGTKLAFFNCAHAVHAQQSAPQGQLSQCTFKNVTAPFYANVGAYGGKGKYGGHMRVLDVDGSLTGTGKPTLLTTKSLSKKSEHHKDWKVYLTPQ